MAPPAGQRRRCGDLFPCFSEGIPDCRGTVQVRAGYVVCRAPAYCRADYEKLGSILRNRTLRRFFGELQGDQLSRPPKGWTASHPALEYLKRKDLLLETALAPEAATGKGSDAELTKRVAALLPFLDFLNAPLLVLKKRQAADPLRNGEWL